VFLPAEREIKVFPIFQDFKVIDQEQMPG
jgi:hypothetical protein